MKKILVVYLLVTLIVQSSFAQERKTNTVYLRNGSIVTGQVFKQRNSERMKLQTPNGSVIFFTEKAIERIVEGENNRPRQRRASAEQATVYLNNGSIITGYVTEPDTEGRMIVETPNRSIIYVTERGTKEIVYDDESPADRVADVAPSSRTRPRTEPAETEPEQPVSRKTQAQTQRRVIEQEEIIDEPIVPVSGYRGFVDAGYTIKMGDISMNRFEFSTSHGYQINPYFFAGAGIGVSMFSDVQLGYVNVADSTSKKKERFKMAIPLFVDLHFNFMEGTIVPFAGIKAGYSIGLSKVTPAADGEGNKEEVETENLSFYLAPSVGVKYKLANSLAINLTVGYSAQMFDYYYAREGITYKKMKNNGGVSVKVGVEF